MLYSVELSSILRLSGVYRFAVCNYDMAAALTHLAKQFSGLVIAGASSFVLQRFHSAGINTASEL